MARPTLELEARSCPSELCPHEPIAVGYPPTNPHERCSSRVCPHESMATLERAFAWLLWLADRLRHGVRERQLVQLVRLFAREGGFLR